MEESSRNRRYLLLKEEGEEGSKAPPLLSLPSPGGGPLRERPLRRIREIKEEERGGTLSCGGSGRARAARQNKKKKRKEKRQNVFAFA